MFDREAIGAIITNRKGYATEQDIDHHINGIDTDLMNDPTAFAVWMDEAMTDVNFVEEM